MRPLDRIRHALAQVDREAVDLVLVVGEGERQGVGAVGDRDRLGLGDLLQPAVERLGLHAGCEERGEDERDAADHGSSLIDVSMGLETLGRRREREPDDTNTTDCRCSPNE